ncbi:MAG TPA: hypothetical protein VM408_04745, partial [Methylomirabilota bacterium]|nr:hypothetical protein [Methylomirabilota bacterium]
DQALGPEDVAVLSASAGAPVVPTGDGAWLEVRDLAPSPALIGAVSDACRARGWLMVESRTVGGSLEDAYLDLVVKAGTGGGESAA